MRARVLVRWTVVVGGLVAAGLGTGCATAAPVGGRTALRTFGPPPLSGQPPELPREAQVAPLDPATLTGDRDTVVALARTLLGKTRISVGGNRYGDDCTGLVRAVYAQIGVDLTRDARERDNGVTALYRFAQRHGHLYEGGWPVPGDLVFFRDTYDRNGDGHRDDGLTHVGLVEDVEADGTVWVIHRVHRGVVRYRMNLSHPTERKNPSGKVWNDVLRARGSGGDTLTAELFASFATVLPPTRVAQR